VGLPRLVVEEAPSTRTPETRPSEQVESEGVQHAIAESRKRPDKGFLLSRDPPEVFGLGFDLAAVGERQVLRFVVALPTLKGMRARSSLSTTESTCARAAGRGQQPRPADIPSRSGGATTKRST